MCTGAHACMSACMCKCTHMWMDGHVHASEGRLYSSLHAFSPDHPILSTSWTYLTLEGTDCSILISIVTMFLLVFDSDEKYKYIMISVRLAGPTGGQLSGCGKKFNGAVFSNTINMINVKLCMMVVLIGHYSFIPPWLYFKVTAVSNSLDVLFSCLIKLKLCTVVGYVKKMMKLPLILIFAHFQRR